MTDESYFQSQHAFTAVKLPAKFDTEDENKRRYLPDPMGEDNYCTQITYARDNCEAFSSTSANIIVPLQKFFSKNLENKFRTWFLLV